MKAVVLAAALFSTVILANAAEEKIVVNTPAELFPLTSVRLLDSPFTKAVAANREYLLALDPDRLLAPYLREAGLQPKKPSYGNWESQGLDGHTAGHYLSALANMIASGDDTKDGELKRRLNYMIDQLAMCQATNGNGYVGGVPGSRQFWPQIAAGNIRAMNGKWVPWYNMHKVFAGLRDAYLVGGNEKAKNILVHLGDWCNDVTANLTDQQMQQMLGTEQGGMNEVLADIYAITGDKKYLALAERFCHKQVLDALEQHQDRLTGLHANTQIPKVVGLERIATLTGDKTEDSGARFFWEDVTGHRTVAFGGNSVSEHFNPTNNFQTMLESRQGPETCNSYNMLRLTEALFSTEPSAAYADYYERTLYNHILASIDPDDPGYVYFTPIRPDLYRVYSQPDTSFWCCVGTGMENPGKYGKFIYAQTADGLYVNLFIASELTEPELGLTLRQDTKFPDEAQTKLSLKLKRTKTFTLHIRHPEWVAAGFFAVKINGKEISTTSTPSSYENITREWRNGDTVEVSLPMRTTIERLPDGSDWVAILHGPIVLAASDGTNNMTGERANASRMAHVANGPMAPLNQVPVLVTSVDDLPSHVIPDPAAGPLHFKLTDVVQPASAKGVTLVPFFRLQDQRYQMYWQLTTAEKVQAVLQSEADTERARIALEAATIDSVAVGEQQPEVEHDLKGDGMDSGIFQNRRWRHGNWFQYTFNLHGAKAADLVVTYSGGDNNRNFDVTANDTLLATEHLTGSQPNQFIDKHYPLPADVIANAKDGRVTIKFSASNGLAGGVFDVRLMKPDTSAGK